MNGSWRLIPPARRYLPAPAPDDPVATELRALAERDRESGRGPADWSDEERERWHGDYRTVMANYEPARWPDRLLAPAAWRDEIVFIALATLMAAVGEQFGDDAWFVFAIQPFWHGLDTIDKHSRRRRAVALGLTPETAPRPGAVSGALFYFPATLGPWLWNKFHGRPSPPATSWSYYLATRLIAAAEERRSWRAAHRPG